MNRNATNSHLGSEASLFGRHPSDIPHESESPFKTPRKVRSKPLPLFIFLAKDAGHRLRVAGLSSTQSRAKFLIHSVCQITHIEG